MGFKEVRSFIGKLEQKRELKRITGQMGGNMEIGAITRKVYSSDGPALIKPCSGGMLIGGYFRMKNICIFHFLWRPNRNT
jgi:hypothetical protein